VGAHERLRSIALEPVEQRLARVLLTLADKIGQRSGTVTEVNVTREEFADMVGTTVETTIRITSKWHHARMISSSRNRIALADPEKLLKNRGRIAYCSIS
jgi:CRP/FNR family transcriptional regulator